MHDVYIIKSEITGRYYICQSKDAIMRLGRHNAGSVRSTKNGRLWKLVKIEKVLDKKEAMRREKQIKSYKGGGAFNKLIATN